MKPIVALDYLERLVEADADFDTGVRHAITTIADYIESGKPEKLLESLGLLEEAATNFVLSVLPHLVSLPKGAFDELIPALQIARRLLGKEASDEISSD